MIKANVNALRRLMMIVDGVVVAAAFAISYQVLEPFRNLVAVGLYLPLLPFLCGSWFLCLFYFGIYDPMRIKTIPTTLATLFKAGFAAFFVFASVAFALKAEYLSRFLLGLTFAMALILLSVQKTVLILLLRYWRKKGLYTRHLLVVGTGKRARAFIQRVEKRREWGLKIAGIVDNDQNRLGKSICGYRVIGSFADIPRIIHEKIVDEIVFIVPRSWLNEIERIIDECEIEGVSLTVAVDHFDTKFAKARQCDLDGMPLLTFDSTPQQIFQLKLKRTFDVLAAGVALLIFSPLFLIIALLIKLTSPGPVFFRQLRCGLNGRQFYLYKFRTMVNNADTQVASLVQKNEMRGPIFKMKNDPRITPLGRLLRKSSLDELPQLWNVLDGSMSIVGPRPPIPQEVKNYQGWQRRRLRMRPGLTCLWQIQGRNEITDFNEWAQLDLDYIDNWSLMLDSKIMLRTIPAVLLGTGAR